MSGALERLQVAPIDLILTDLQLDDQSGLQLIDEVKSSFADLPVIVMTAVGSEEAAVEAIHRGAASYLPKRQLQSWLLKEVEGVLDRARAARARGLLTKTRTASTEQYSLPTDREIIPGLIQKLLASLAEFHLCSERRRLRIGVALEEALLNAIIHGNLEISSELRGVDDEAYERLIADRSRQPPYQNRTVNVLASLDMNRAVIVIRDAGRGFDVSKLPDPTQPENMERAHGRGLLLIRSFFDEVIHNERGNEIRLVVRRELSAAKVKSPQLRTLSGAMV